MVLTSQTKLKEIFELPTKSNTHKLHKPWHAHVHTHSHTHTIGSAGFSWEFFNTIQPHHITAEKRGDGVQTVKLVSHQNPVNTAVSRMCGFRRRVEWNSSGIWSMGESWWKQETVVGLSAWLPSCAFVDNFFLNWEKVSLFSQIVFTSSLRQETVFYVLPSPSR